MKTDLFHSATLRLTAWYMAILVVLCLLFSLIVFNIAGREFERNVGPRRPGETQIFIDSDFVDELRQSRIAESKRHLIGDLFVFNFFTLALGGGASYLLARRTLRPIEQALDAQSRFSSDAAHELRTPLAVMQTEIEVELRNNKATKASHSETLESNLEEVERLRTLTDRLLLLAGNQPLPLGPVQLEDAAIDAVNRLIPLAQAKKIVIENDIKPTMIQAHTESVADILTILIENAIKYSPDKSVIKLMSSAEEKMAVISVADEGIGLTADEQEHVFERFYRADAARSAQHVAGHGLGLSIARQLVELQKGTITVKSEKDKGSTFTVRLALAD